MKNGNSSRASPIKIICESTFPDYSTSSLFTFLVTYKDLSTDVFAGAEIECVAFAHPLEGLFPNSPK